MRTTLTAAAVVLLVTLTGCGEEGDTGAGGRQPSAETSPGTTSSPTEADGTPSTEADRTATRVDFTRSGGITGDETSYTFEVGGEPPQGFTGREQERVLAAASAPALRELSPDALPKDLCCDLFIYEVTVTWDDGTSRTYAAADGVEAPAPLDALIAAAG